MEDDGQPMEAPTTESGESREPLSPSALMLWHRVRRLDSHGRGLFGRVKNLGRAHFPEERSLSESRTRQCLRELQRKGYLHPIGATDRGVVIYLRHDQRYSSDLVAQMMDPVRSGNLPWSTEAAERLLTSESGKQPLNRVAPTKYRDIKVSAAIRRQYRAEIWQAAIDEMIADYGPSLRGAVSPPRLMESICRRLVEQASEQKRRRDEALAAQLNAARNRRTLAQAAELAQQDPQALQAMAQLFGWGQGGTVQAQPAPQAPQRETTLHEAIESFVALRNVDGAEGTRRYYKEHVPVVLAHVGDMPLSSVNHDTVVDYCQRRSAAHEAKRGRPLSRRTLQIELSILRGALQQARLRDQSLANPGDYWPRLRLQSAPRKQYLQKEHYVLLQKQLKPYQRSWLLWFVVTGARLAELRRVTGADVDLSARTLRLRGRKLGDSDRIVPLNARLVAWIRKRWPAGRIPSGPLLEPWGRPWQALRRACDRAGIPRVSANDLRRTFASWLKQGGRDTAVVSKLMGHTTSRQVDRVYGQMGESQYRDAVDGLDVPEEDQES